MREKQGKVEGEGGAGGGAIYHNVLTSPQVTRLDVVLRPAAHLTSKSSPRTPHLPWRCPVRPPSSPPTFPYPVRCCLHNPVPPRRCCMSPLLPPRPIPCLLISLAPPGGPCRCLSPPLAKNTAPSRLPSSGSAHEHNTPDSFYLYSSASCARSTR